ncbi:hypothetical protein ACFQ51_31800 [Streptomyces kaempferi]
MRGFDGSGDGPAGTDRSGGAAAEVTSAVSSARLRPANALAAPERPASNSAAAAVTSRTSFADVASTAAARASA